MYGCVQGHVVLSSVAILVFLLLTSFLLLRPSLHAHASGGIWQQYTYSGPAGSRPYFVYTPVGYQVGTAVPLVVMLHSCGQTPSDFAGGTQMNQLANQKQFIVVYPQQTMVNNVSACWKWFDASNQVRGSGEPAIIAGIVQAVVQNTSHWTIDSHRIYVAGLSAGAAMAVIMGATYPDIFAAIGVHSGLEYQAATSVSGAFRAQLQGGPDPSQQGKAAYRAMGNAARVVPTIVFQGTNDTVVNPINGDQVVQQWMQTDRLASNDTDDPYNASFNSPATTTNGQVVGGHSYTTYTWTDSSGAEVEEYWKINGLGHAWSGGDISGSFTDPLGPNASLAFYNFFINHHL
jgi:poly(hydroxyalkanoate) depolymerase family esterase